MQELMCSYVAQKLGSKANATTVYGKRYREATEMVILILLPHGWAPDTVIVEGMFLIIFNHGLDTQHSQIMQTL